MKTIFDLSFPPFNSHLRAFPLTSLTLWSVSQLADDPILFSTKRQPTTSSDNARGKRTLWTKPGGREGDREKVWRWLRILGGRILTFDAHCCHMGTAFFDIRALWHSGPGHSDAQPWASECPDIKNYKWRLNPVCRFIAASAPVWQQWASKG